MTWPRGDSTRDGRKRKVRAALLAHLERERRYLERRQRSGTRTSYDDVTETDQIVLALAICFLAEDADAMP